MTRSTKTIVKDPVYVHQFPDPFTYLNEEVDELPIRKPNGLDMIEIGSPVVFDCDTGKAELDLPRCYAMTARLSGMHEKVLLGIDTGEMLDLFWLVSSFFMKGRQNLLPALQRSKDSVLQESASPKVGSAAQLGSPEPSPAASTQASP